MIDAEFLAYRAVATPIEDAFHGFAEHNKNPESKVAYLADKLLRRVGDYEHVCLLRLLCQELALIESIHGIGAAAYGSAKDRYDELYGLARFDPLSLHDCASYYFYDLGDAGKAKTIALYAIFIAERLRAYVRLSHQLLLRIAHAEGDLGAAEVAVRRIAEYEPDAESPDPAIERDIIAIVGGLSLDPALKAAFFKAVSDQNP
jgi:hypothetical protein